MAKSPSTKTEDSGLYLTNISHQDGAITHTWSMAPTQVARAMNGRFIYLAGGGMWIRLT